MLALAKPGHIFKGNKMPHKKGGNKGIAKAKKARKREEAEERNARTPIEKTRAYRRRLEGEKF